MFEIIGTLVAASPMVSIPAVVLHGGLLVFMLASILFGMGIGAAFGHRRLSK